VAVEAKICGLTRPEDAAIAARLGAARLGVVFAWGPRVVTVEQAREIVAASGGVPVIGVMGPGSASGWLGVAREAGLSGVQLHGGASDAEAGTLRAAGLEVWRVATLAADADPEAVIGRLRTNADAVLVEAGVHGGSGGGRGIRLDVELARRARAVLADASMVLAGGLDPDNVAEAIRLVGPDLVDVSSGVEISPGIKDMERIARFLEAAGDSGSPTRRGR